jgi:hypothetical protein
LVPFPIHLRIVDIPDGSWRIEIGDRSTRATEATMAPREVSAMRMNIRAGLAVLPAVVIPGFDANRCQRETSAGRALSAAVNASAGVAARLAYQMGIAQERGETPVIAVDSRSATVRDLPWELLALDEQAAPVESSGRAVVVRLGEGRLRRSPATASQLRVLVWRAQDDDASESVASALARTLSDRGIVSEHVTDLRSLPDPVPDTADILHIVCHGKRVVDQVRLLLDDGEQGPETTSHLMASRLTSLEAVVLDVCVGGQATTSELDGLATRLVATGAPACVAPARKVSTNAAAAFSQTLYPALAGGESLCHAVAKGRAAVAGLGVGHPDSRWSNHILNVGDLDTVARKCLVSRQWRPQGWPIASPDAAAFLTRAHELAVQGNAGFVGLEHFALALHDVEGGGKACGVARFVLSDRERLTERLRGGLAPVDDVEAAWATTPRIREYSVNLPTSFDLEALWRLISADPHHILHVLAKGRLLAHQGRRDSHATLPSHIQFTPGTPLGRPETLQVVGGPEDGRNIAPNPGDVIGRWAPNAPGVAHTLYMGTSVRDPHLSRQHMTWVGPGTINLRKNARVRRGAREIIVRAGDSSIQTGDLLMLTNATWLRALARAPGFRERQP